MKTLEFIYQETEIHFLINPTDKNVMINATEMAKLFKKEPKDFLRLNGTKKYIEALLKSNYIVADSPRYNEQNIVNSNNKAGTYMHRKLALKFAAWLDVEFELWIFDMIDKIINGFAKDFNKAVFDEKQAKEARPILKSNLISNPTKESAIAFFDNEDRIKTSQKNKNLAVKNQLELFEEEQKNQKR